eukprot:3885367-Rhodomonas_salina.2
MASGARAISLRPCYAMRDPDFVFGAVCLCACYPMRGADVAHVPCRRSTTESQPRVRSGAFLPV